MHPLLCTMPKANRSRLELAAGSCPGHRGRRGVRQRPGVAELVEATARGRRRGTWCATGMRSAGAPQEAAGGPVTAGDCAVETVGNLRDARREADAARHPALAARCPRRPAAAAGPPGAEFCGLPSRGRSLELSPGRSRPDGVRLNRGSGAGAGRRASRTAGGRGIRQGQDYRGSAGGPRRADRDRCDNRCDNGNENPRESAQVCGNRVTPSKRRRDSAGVRGRARVRLRTKRPGVRIPSGDTR